MLFFECERDFLKKYIYTFSLWKGRGEKKGIKILCARWQQEIGVRGGRYFGEASNRMYFFYALHLGVGVQTTLYL